MALSNHDQARIRGYLLGQLSDEEQQKLEERLMTEDDVFEELEISKGELIEEYRAGELPDNERQWFERHYLASPEGKQRYTFVTALGCLKRPSPAPQSLTLFERLSSLFREQRWALATAALVVLVGIVAIALLFSPSQTSLSITLNSGAINRSSTETSYPTITLKPDVGELRISLMLAEPATPGVNYRVELDNRREIKTLEPAGRDANSVLVVIPARQLPPGFYALTLFERKVDGTERQIPGNYFFIVQ